MGQVVTLSEVGWATALQVGYRPNGLLVRLPLSAWDGRDRACAFRDVFTGGLQMFRDIGEVCVMEWEADKLPL